MLRWSQSRRERIALMTEYDCDSVADAVEIASTIALK